MDKILDRILKFFENKSVSLSKRTSIFIISIFVLLTCDYFFDFSYDYHLSNKIEKLESINKLKKIYKSDSIKRFKLIELENIIFERTHYSERFRKLDLNEFKIFEKSETTEINKPVIKKDNTTINKPIRSYFWMMISSNYILIIIFILLFFLPVNLKQHRKGAELLGLIAGIIIVFVSILIITWISFRIPLIYEKPLYNYILNGLIHIIFMIPLIKLFK
jgi:hypothetical protein